MALGLRMSWPDQLSTQQKCLLHIVYSFLTQGSLAWLTSQWSDSRFFSPQQFVRDLVNFHEPQHELYHLTMRDSSFWERHVWWTLGKKERGKKKDRKMENRAGTSSRFIWGRDSEPLEKGWRLKPGPHMGGGYTKGVVTSRHGMSKPPLFFSGVWEIKEGKIGLFYSPDPWTQWDRVKTVPGNNLCSHYLNPLRMRTAGHAPGPMLYCEDEKRISELLYF